jgi:transposase
MIRLSFTEEEMKELEYYRYHHPHPRVQKKMEVLLLKGKGLSNEQIAHCAGICENTMRSYFKDYHQGGIEGLKQVKFRQPQSELQGHRSTLEEYFKEHPPTTIAQAAHSIEQLTGLKRSEKQVRIFLKKTGMKRLKTCAIPAKCDVEAQEEFKKKELEPRLEEAKAGKRTVFFVDAAHFVLSAYLGWLWCFQRVLVRAPSGRQRFNVLGALNAVTHQLVTITNDSYINSESVGQLLHKIAALGLQTPITLVMDNARYQRCRYVLDMAAKLNIEILFLPSYSPNLNLIERLWKFVRKECLYDTYYENFSLFKQSISDCLSQTTTRHQSALRSLLTLSFQSFEKLNL